MSESLGPIAFEPQGGRTLFGRGIEAPEYSQEISAKIDAEVKAIINDAIRKGETILKNHRNVLNAIAKELILLETIERESFEKILIANGVTPKKKEDRP